MNESSMREAPVEQNSDPMFGHGQKMLKQIVASEERRARRLAQSTIAVWTAWLCVLFLAAYSFVSGPLIQINLGPSGPLNAAVVPYTAPVAYPGGSAAPQYYAPGAAPSQYSTPAYAAPMFLPGTSTQATAPLAFTPVPTGDSAAEPGPSSGPLSYVPDDAAPTYSSPPAVPPMPIQDTPDEPDPNTQAAPYAPGGMPPTYYAPPAASPTYCPLTAEPAEGAAVATTTLPQMDHSPTSIAKGAPAFSASILSAVSLVGVPVLPVIGTILLVLAILARRSATLTQIRASLGVIELQLKQLSAAQKGSLAGSAASAGQGGADA